MESSHTAGLVKPSEWILLVFATVLLGAAVSQQRATIEPGPVEAKIDIPADQAMPVNGSIIDVSMDTTIVTVMARPIEEPATDTSN